MNLSVKNNIVHQRVGKILKFTSQIKRSAPREWEGQSEARGGAFPRQGKYERSEVGGAERGNLCEFQNLSHFVFKTVFPLRVARICHIL